MSSKYDAVSGRALATIARKGADVAFGTSTGGIYDPLTDTWSGGTAGSAIGKAVQIANDETLLAALQLLTRTTVTLLVAAKGLTVGPDRDMPMTWAGVGYRIADVQATAPDGTPILYQIVGAV
jgi:hypothetical protein